ncbi:MAG: ribosome biogenesis GTPase YlqF [Syntrophaceticus sp.]|nr:ribosome biogenesis GTPase YlqF [Syntrophaceticus sp.]MDD3314035.1 ribosome biogenesis GTPase YlqF [Syntrophaceticus sp.]MDD4358944.1 ribosome biogenesis GTPase YlqF [Syntrophaceticus sp.]MDD4782558.1 ribosome biogenesis GTPase YlqF [Syntrophaceticus sp.]HBG22266.1 ribosome biogenesis GTPase YlqF [Peptococcaceae bacterium]
MNGLNKLNNLSKLLKIVDVIFEIADARCPLTSRSKQVTNLIKDKRSILVLNKSDLADPRVTADWVKFFADRDEQALPVDAVHGEGMKGVRSVLNREAKRLNQVLREKGRRKRPLRVAVLGIPNTGKSSFLNRILGKRSVIRGNRPGVTRGPQWVHVHDTISVLDTPGLLSPYLKGENVFFILALVRAIDPERLEQVNLGEQLLNFLSSHYADALLKLGVTDAAPTLESVAGIKGFLTTDGEFDLQRAAVYLLNSYSKGNLGRISLETPSNFE